MARLYAVATTQKSNRQIAQDAVKRYRKLKPVEHLRLERATVREGAGMRWMPAWYSFWWKTFVIRAEKPLAEILYPKSR